MSFARSSSANPPSLRTSVTPTNTSLSDGSMPSSMTARSDSPGGEIALATKAIRAHEARLLPLAKDMLRADGGALFGVDFIALAAINRSAALTRGFLQMLEDRNFLCLAALLRLQLDSALRFAAFFFVKQPHKVAIAVLRGMHLGKFKDRTGKALTDRRLTELLATAYPWIPNVYRQTSGYIHLSEKHILATFGSEKPANADLEVQLGPTTGDALAPELFAEAAEAYAATLDVLICYVAGWTSTKNNPRGNPPVPDVRARTHG
jgi:hypothetical protein